MYFFCARLDPDFYEHINSIVIKAFIVIPYKI